MIMSRLTFAAALAVVGLLGACSSSEDASQRPQRSLAESDIAALVNGEQISIAQVQRQAAQRGSGDAPGDPASATQELINLLLLSQEAIRQGLDGQPAVAEELVRQKFAVLASALIEKHVGDMPIEEEDLRAEYATQIASLDGNEYLARHILLSEQEQADEMIKQLRLGADFGELAKRNSIGPSARQGGDLGWFQAGQMVPLFAEALRRMQVGEVSKPVQTKFGWHVIQLQDKRAAPVPDFATIKPRLTAIVRNKRLHKLVDGLRENAEIEIKAPQG